MAAEEDVAKVANQRYGGVPLWVWGVGVAAIVVVYVWWRNRTQAGGTTTTVTSPDTASGLMSTAANVAAPPPGNNMTTDDWVNNALTALRGKGDQVSILAALGRFLRGDVLSQSDIGIVDQAIGAIGMPPGYSSTTLLQEPTDVPPTVTPPTQPPVNPPANTVPQSLATGKDEVGNPTMQLPQGFTPTGGAGSISTADMNELFGMGYSGQDVYEMSNYAAQQSRNNAPVTKEDTLIAALRAKGYSEQWAPVAASYVMLNHPNADAGNVAQLAQQEGYHK